MEDAFLLTTQCRILLLVAYFKEAAFSHRAPIFIFSIIDWKSIPSPQQAGGQQKTSPARASTQTAAKAPNAGNLKLSFPQHLLLITVTKPPEPRWETAPGTFGCLAAQKGPRGLAALPGAEWRPLGGSLPAERRGTKRRFLPRRLRGRGHRTARSLPGLNGKRSDGIVRKAPRLLTGAAVYTGFSFLHCLLMESKGE